MARQPDGCATTAASEPGADAPGGCDERAWVERAGLRDEEAFRMLVDRYRDRAFGLAFRITHSRAEAEDAAQEAFVRAWQALPRFRGESSFGTWLHRIVARRALDRAMALRARTGREVEVAAADDLVAPPEAEADLVLRSRLERLMVRLSAPQRAVVALFYGQDLQVQEIATALGMPDNTVKTHLRRARAALREAWMQADGEAP